MTERRVGRDRGCREERVGRAALATSGYTLIELGVVLGVIAIISGAVMVSVVEIAKNRAAQNAAEQIVMIQQAAKDYYHDSMIDTAGGEIKPDLAHWPSEQAASATMYYTCKGGGILDELIAKGLVKMKKGFEGKNAWGNEYKIELRAGGDPDTDGRVWKCALWIGVDVPPEVAGVLETYLPAATCNDDTFCGSPETGKRCCTQIPRPGMEASMTRAKSAWNHAPGYYHH